MPAHILLGRRVARAAFRPPQRQLRPRQVGQPQSTVLAPVDEAFGMLFATGAVESILTGGVAGGHLFRGSTTAGGHHICGRGAGQTETLSLTQKVLDRRGVPSFRSAGGQPAG
jgi:hypothetical protein